MKGLKKRVLMVVAGVSLTIGMAGTGFGFTCQEGNLTSAGVNPDADPNIYEIMLECPAEYSGSRTFFLSYSTLGDAGYATALSAVAAGKMVEVQTTRSAAFGLATKIRLLDVDVSVP